MWVCVCAVYLGFESVGVCGCFCVGVMGVTIWRLCMCRCVHVSVCVALVGVSLCPAVCDRMWVWAYLYVAAAVGVEWAFGGV